MNKKLHFFPTQLLLIFTIVLLFLSKVNAQTIGDYGLPTGGDWNTLANWKTWDGSSFATSATVLPNSTNDVYVPAGQTANTAAITQTSAITNTSNAVTLAAPNASILVGMLVTGTGIPANTTVAAVSGTSLTLSNNATATNASAALTFASSICRNLFVDGTLTIGTQLNTAGNITVNNGGTLTQGATVYCNNVTVNTGGIYTSNSSNSTNRSLFIGYASVTAQTGDFVIQNNGRFGGTAVGANDGIAIFYSERADNITLRGTASGTGGTTFIGRLMPNNSIDFGTSNNFTLSIEQNLTVTLSSNGIGLSLQNNRIYNSARTRTCNILSGVTVTAGSNFVRIHSNAAATAVTGDCIYNIYGTLDLGTNNGQLQLYTNSSGTNSLTFNVGDGTLANAGTLRLGRTISLVKLTAQTLAFNFSNFSTVEYGPTTGNPTFTFTNNGVSTPTLFPSNFYNFILSNSSGLTLPSATTINNQLRINNGTLNVAPGLTLGSNANAIIAPSGVLNISAGVTNFADRPVTLQSNATSSARIANIVGTLSNATNVTTETYIPGGRRAFRFLSHPFTSAQAMSSLMDDIFVTGGNYLTGFDSTGTQSSSSFWFNDASNTWTAFTSTSDASWAQHRGARVLVRGDRTQADALTGATYTPNAVTLDVTGAVNTGNQNISLSNAGNFHFVGNPYPSPINIGTVIDATSDIGTTYWVWDANAATRGAYLRRTKGSGAYNLAMNGAFFVQPTASTTLAFTESNKVATATANLFRAQATQNQLELQVNYNGTYADKLFVRNDATATAAKQLSEDGSKLMNPDVNMFTLATGNEALTLDARPIANTTVIPVGFTSSIQSSFEIALNSNTLNNGLPVVLKDKYLNVEHVLTETSPYSFAVTADAASQGNDRFELVFRTSAVLPTTFVSVAAQQKGAAIEVTFTTANESNMNGYEVEKSKDGTSFTRGTTVAAKNTASYSYTWLDVNINNGNNYYRIKAIEKNGAVKYSQVVRVNIGKQTSDFAVYPNPVKGGVVNLQLTDIDKGVYMVKIYNNIGQEIAGKQINHHGGSANQTISIGNVPTGKYNMLITNGTTSVNKTVIVE